ncbi:hypothetical protein FOA52_010543 [Chlamydomonas sp. UWO 241]|nr:hypothetical protein FOA52_010543 [Chlamydomonas sp. UWO 241]
MLPGSMQLSSSPEVMLALRPVEDDEAAASEQQSAGGSGSVSGRSHGQDGKLEHDVEGGGGQGPGSGSGAHPSGSSMRAAGMGEREFEALRHQSQLISEPPSTSGRGGGAARVVPRPSSSRGTAGLHLQRPSAHAQTHASDTVHSFFTEAEHADAEEVPFDYSSLTSYGSFDDLDVTSPSDHRRPHQRHKPVLPQGLQPRPGRRRKRSFRFTVSRTSDADLFADTSLPQQQREQQQGGQQEQQQAGLALRVHMRPPPACRAPVLYVHCSVDGGVSWWSQLLVRAKAAQRPLLMAHLRVPAHMERRMDRAHSEPGARPRHQVALFVSDTPASPGVEPPRGLEVCTLDSDAPGSFWLDADSPTCMEDVTAANGRRGGGSTRGGTGGRAAGRAGSRAPGSRDGGASGQCEPCGSAYGTRATRLLTQPLLLALDLCVVAGRRAHARDDVRLARFGDSWVRSQELHPGLLALSTSRGPASFHRLWADKREGLPQPDVLLLAGGTEVAYRTPGSGSGGYSTDGEWSARLAAPAAGWQRSRVEAAVSRLVASCDARRHAAASAAQTALAEAAGGRPGPSTTPVLPPRVKLDGGRQQQGVLRVRLLVSGGPGATAAVAAELEELLRQEAEAVVGDGGDGSARGAAAGAAAGNGAGVQPQPHAARAAHQLQYHQHNHPQSRVQHGAFAPAPRWRARPRMLWRVVAYGHVEGGGAAHRGWCALDVVPAPGGPAAALRHVMGRFGLAPSLVACALDAGCDDVGAVVRLCGAGSVLVGTHPPPLPVGVDGGRAAGGRVVLAQALGPQAVIDGLRELGLS